MANKSVILNIEAISNGIKAHNQQCDFPATEVQLNPFEQERLGWDEILGVPIIGNPDIQTGRFLVICDGSAPKDDLIEISKKELVYS